MSKTHIVVGDKGRMDISVLLKTRLLIQANSGGGKSWLLRRLAEQLFGLVPVLIIDPEGEFATLREKFGYVLVGKGGETPADPRSAKLVAHKLLELQASAVCDIYEMNPSARHHWVKLFLEALVDAPKSLWRPTFIIVDEAHTFCPEKGQGESEAAEAMTALASRGRKRRFCAIWATQRLAKLNKSATAELLNRLVGPTFEDVDLKRAADLLSIAKENRREWEKEMRVLEPGKFYALGRAISTERVLVKVGDVQTSHEVEDAKPGLGPPPTPDKIKSLLPKLADLPKEAEEKLRTETELRAEIRTLKQELAHKTAATKTKIEQKEVPVFTDQERKSILKIGDAYVHWKDQVWKLHDLASEGHKLLEEISRSISARITPPQRFGSAPVVRPSVPIRQVLPGPGKATLSLHRPGGTALVSNGSLPKAERAILRVLANFPEGKTRREIGVIAGYKHTGGGFNNALGSLRSNGFISGSDPLKITDAGLQALGPVEPLPTGKDLFDYWMQHPDLGRAEREVLRVLYISGKPMSKEDIAPLTISDRGTPYEANGGGFNNAIGRLRAYELIDGGRGELQAANEFFQ